MVVSSRISALAVFATVINLFAVLYFLIFTADDRLAMMQVHFVAEIEFLVLISWLLAKLSIAEQKPSIAG
ncbi:MULTISPECIES: hypothetical protein [Cupriavidus]|jgi:hypothetical protein|uniref:Uncharacterized protein n=1 Tax=Cupriavidus basilensis TaxID=68895 RepID=A0A643FR75_9BURK|nr:MULTISPECIES: hypothetical protein [Cupriavidus]KUE86395.1 hypothetical protein ASL20_23310 [Cupriavidus necator]NOV23595.1 hypothetical protein [Cupriavidus necator]QOT81669.1 hypothetical protein F7R26_037270 [Cupriavidus basilensis]BDB30120.1 hypothetical protein CTP10_R75370 [Cupriavidus sp. P-10]